MPACKAISILRPRCCAAPTGWARKPSRRGRSSSSASHEPPRRHYAVAARALDRALPAPDAGTRRRRLGRALQPRRNPVRRLLEAPARQRRGLAEPAGAVLARRGVDHLMGDPQLPAVPVVRVVDDDLTNRMSEYVVLHCLMHLRRQRAYDAQQRQKLWLDDRFQPGAHHVRVGIMGLGVLGQDVARKLKVMGFDVAGWSRSPRSADGIETFSGAEGLDRFLARTDILVCLLPLTQDTRGILNRSVFAR